MHAIHLSLLGAALVAAGLGAPAAAARAPDARAAAGDPFAQPSSLPFGIPPFDRIHDRNYRPAFAAGMAEQLREIAAIAADPHPATFDNTIVALERSGQHLVRVQLTFSNLNDCNTDPELQRIAAEMAPRLSAHHDAIHLNAALWARIDRLYQARADLGLDPESLQLLARYHTLFVLAGARLPAPERARLRALNRRIASLVTGFRQHVLQATQAGAVQVDSETELAGLAPEQVGAAAAAAAARGLKGKWLIGLQNTTDQPILADLRNRALRERVYRASIGRNTSGATDNRAAIAELVRLRAERATLLGYASHADYRLADESAGTPAAVRGLIQQIAPAALARARSEAGELQKMMDTEAAAAGKAPTALQPWDWLYYSEQVRKARYDFDQASVAPYFELEHVLRDGVFYSAHELFGLSFRERHDLPVYDAGVRVFEVLDADGTPLALFLADNFARANKQGGAWESTYVAQSKLLRLRPVAAIHLNIDKRQPGQPVLLTFDEVRTLFHEFGHALHDMLSDVHYPLLAGTAVPNDFVEYPSQYNEMWAHEPAVVAHYAHHYQTGEAMPAALLDRVIAAQTFNEGYATLEYLEAALLDLAWHQLGAGAAPAARQVEAFERTALAADGFGASPVPPRYHSTYFSHIFSPEDSDYSAAYYAYLWSEVLARDTGHWFHTHGGLTRANGEYLRSHVLSRGRSDEPQALFRAFYGGPPDIGPLLEYRGLRRATGD